LTDNNFPELGEESFDENRFLLNPLIDCNRGKIPITADDIKCSLLELNSIVEQEVAA
jgi:hypothetical protein